RRCVQLHGLATGHRRHLAADRARPHPADLHPGRVLPARTRYRARRRAPRRAPQHSAPYVEQHRTERAARIVEAVVTAADGLGTSPLAVALAWVRDRPGVVAPIVGARDTAQLAGSLATEDLTLPPAIRAALDDVSGVELGYPERRLG